LLFDCRVEHLELLIQFSVVIASQDDVSQFAVIHLFIKISFLFFGKFFDLWRYLLLKLLDDLEVIGEVRAFSDLIKD
jgi:hypothetical protein